MHLALCVFLYSVTLSVVSNYYSSWQDSDLIIVFIIIMQIAIFILFHSKPKVAIFLHTASD